MLRLYLKKDVEKRDGFVEVCDEESKTFNSYIECYFAGRRIYSGSLKEKEFCLKVWGFNEYIPEEFQDLIMAVSFNDGVSESMQRRCYRGRYCKGSAWAIIDGGYNLAIEIKGDNLEDVYSLYCMIRSGEIQPFEKW